MPTENRSSNTEMVSVPREPCGEMLNAARNAPIPLVHLDSMSARQDLEFSARYKAAVSRFPQPAPQPHHTHADPGEVERLRIELDLRTQEREKFLGWCMDARAESTKLRAQLAELVSAVRSINFGPAHAIQMRGDDEPCYPQRKEWIEWLLELCEATSVEPSASAGSEPWLPLTAPGQIQVGDWLSFTVAGSFICAKARLIIAPGTANEEIVYNLKKNHYFCTDMAIDGTSNHKGVLVAKAKP